MSDFIQWIVSPANLFAVIAAGLVFATVWTLSSPALGGDNLNKRMKAVSNRREELRRKAREELDELEQRLRSQEARASAEVSAAAEMLDAQAKELAQLQAHEAALRLTPSPTPSEKVAAAQ